MRTRLLLTFVLYLAGSVALLTYAQQYNYYTTFGTYGSGSGQFSFNIFSSIAVYNNKVYVTDELNNRIQVLTQSGSTLGVYTSFATPGDNLGIDDPAGILIGDDGKIYVTNSGNNRLHVLTQSGTTLGIYTSLGTLNRGSGNNQFDTPIDVSVNSSGQIYIIDEGNSRMQVLTQSGTILGVYVTYDRSLDNPTVNLLGVTVGNDGKIYVTNRNGGDDQILVLTQSGTTLGKYTTFGSAGPGNGQFDLPIGIHVANDGKIYVADVGNGRVQVLTQSGTNIGYYATIGTGIEGSANDQLYAPSDVFVTDDGKVYIVDSGNNRIQVFTEHKTSQEIGFSVLPAVTYGDAPFAINATATSGLTVSFTSSNPSIAAIGGNTLTILGAGVVTVTAFQPGDGTYGAAIPVSQVLTINKANQTITFPAISTTTYGSTPFTLLATVSSGLTASYSVTGPALVSGNSVTVTGVGVITVTAFQAGNANYNAATNVVQVFTVNKANQTINFPAIANTTYMITPFALLATMSSGLTVSYSVTGPALVSGNLLTVTGAGVVTVTAFHAGNSNYNAASNVVQVFTVNKSNQVINFSTIPTMTYGDAPLSLSPMAMASSGLIVSYSVTGPALIVGNKISAMAVGVVTITAFQLGNANYNAAPNVVQTFNIIKGNQTITFPSVGIITYGSAPIALSATASSWQIVSYSVTGPALISGNSLMVTGLGVVTVTAFQAGNAYYNAAANVVQVSPSAKRTKRSASLL